MWLNSLKLKHFRNYEEADIHFHPGLNIFLGQNAQGKTNILESIYFLALTRSHRTRSDKDLVHFQEKELRVSGIIKKNTSTIPLDIELTTKGRITKINHLKQSRLSDYIGTMIVVLFAPEDLQLIKGSPSLRRKFIDIELGQIKPLYLSDLSNYNHVLKQRNSYLKNNQHIDENFLSVLDEQLVEYGCRVIQHRLDFLQKLEKFLFYPKECPHGSPIFYDSDGFNEANIMKLSDTEERDEIIILSVEDNIELYDYLREMDVTIKENYNIIRKDPFNGPIYLKNSQKKVKIIAYDAAKLIEIYKKNTEENNEYEQ